MKCTDLMIGDLLRVNRDGLCIKKGTIVQVRGIDGDNKFEEKGLVGCVDCRPLDKMQFDGGIWLDYLSPIPLTPEILEKNGFVEEEYPIIYDRREFELRHGGYRIIVSPLNDGYTRIYKGGYLPILNNCYINFIHELQHALRLCGIEKELML